MYPTQVIQALEQRVRTETFFMQGFRGAAQERFRANLLKVAPMMADDVVVRIIDFLEAATNSLQRDQYRAEAIAVAKLQQDIRRITHH